MSDRARDYYLRDLNGYEFVHKSNSELVRLQQEALGGNQEAWEELWMYGVRLVHKICYKLLEIEAIGDDQLDDCIQEGNLAVGTALNYWSNNQGRYSTYIWVCARKAVQKYVREEYAGGITGEKDEKFFHLDQDADISLDGWSPLMYEFYNDPRRGDVEQQRISEMDMEAALSILTGREEYILRKYFYEDMSDPEIGILLGISKQAVGQHRKKALDTLQLYFS